MGFGYGLLAGTRSAKSWVDTYNETKENQIENMLFTAAQKLGEEQMSLDAEGNEMEQAGMLFSQMSPHDVAGALMEQVVAAGGKIDDQTARLAYGVGEQLVGLKDKYMDYQERRELFGLKKRNMESIIQKRSVLKGKRDKLFADEDIVPSVGGIPTIEEFAKSKGIRRGRYGNYDAATKKAYFKSYPAAAETAVLDAGTLQMLTDAGQDVSHYDLTNQDVVKDLNKKGREYTLAKAKSGLKTQNLFGELGDEPEDDGFPKNPKRGQGHQSDDGQYWVFDGEEWRVKEEKGFFKSLFN